MSVREKLDVPPHVRAMTRVVDDIVGARTFGGTMADRDCALAAYRLRERDVRAAFAPDRLLVYDVAEGWAPLCRFLGVAVPAAPFPRRNAKAEFWERLGGEPPEIRRRRSSIRLAGRPAFAALAPRW